QVSPTPADRILERVRPWIEETIEEDIIQEMFEVSLAPMREKLTSEYLDLLKDWSRSDDNDQQLLGLMGLSTLLRTNSFDNFPVIFKLIEKSFELEKKKFRPYHLEIFKHLVRLSNQETVHYLKEILFKYPNKETRWLIRNLLNIFLPEQQDEFKNILRNNR
ncbi:MAG: hypothetical protein HOF10_07620, partial [Chloroflexi bacterium]|nr:hypothetical protein [Chloroflexota bacterium]